MKNEVSLKDITWGGRIRIDYKGKIWDVATRVAISNSSSVSGNMLTSQQFDGLYFLDGGVSQSQGFFGGGDGGMRWFGDKAICYIIYELGLDPSTILNRKDVLSHKELNIQLAEDKKAIQKKLPDNFMELIQKVGDRAMQRVANENSSDSLTESEWLDTAARSLVKDGLAKDLNEAIKMVKETI